MEVRIDKYLWCIRAFKTRSEAADACLGGKVKLGGISVKPSRDVKVGEVYEVRKGPVTYTYRVKALISSRVGASLVPDYAENLTPQEEIQKIKAPIQTVFVSRDRGSGRPTKRERRVLDELMDSLDFD